jgi:hypothetical protein
MSANPYAPPSTEVADVPAQGQTGEAPFFAVSTTKLLVMSLCTVTIYHVYWFYQNWARIKRRKGVSMLPALRAVFAVFFCYQLFAEVRDYDRRSGNSASLAAGTLAIGWIVSTVFWRLPDPYWLVALGATLFMLPVQSRANAINAVVAPGHDPNFRFTAWNWVAVVLGGAVLLLAIVGTLAPPA